MNIYVGNIGYSVTEGQLRSAFEEYGSVDSVKIITDRMTGQSKGFGFVEMADDEEGQAAIDALNDYDLGGRSLKVNQARPKEDNRGGGGRRGGFGGGGGYGGGGGGGGYKRRDDRY